MGLWLWLWVGGRRTRSWIIRSIDRWINQTINPSDMHMTHAHLHNRIIFRPSFTCSWKRSSHDTHLHAQKQKMTRCFVCPLCTPLPYLQLEALHDLLLGPQLLPRALEVARGHLLVRCWG